MRMIKLVSVICGALHICACMFWRVKVESSVVQPYHDMKARGTSMRTTRLHSKQSIVNKDFSDVLLNSYQIMN